MKILSLKRFFCALFLISFVSFSAFSQDFDSDIDFDSTYTDDKTNPFTELGFHFSVEPLYFFEMGTLNEFVFSKDSENQKYKLSELNWNVNNHEIGMKAEFGWKWIGLDTSFSFGVPGDSGYMYDSDWMHSTNHSMKTNLSKSDEYMNEAKTFSIGLFGDFPVTPESSGSYFCASVIPSFKYDYSYYYFSGYNGAGWYGSSYSNNPNAIAYDDPLATYYKKGQLFGIDYSHEHHNLFFGLGVDLQVLKRLNIHFDYKFSCYTLVNSVDTHFTNDKRSTGSDYNDQMEDSFKTSRFFASLEYNFWDNFSIGTSYYYYHQPLTEGVTYTKSHTATEYTKSNSATSGCSAETHSFSVYIKYAMKKTPYFY